MRDVINNGQAYGSVAEALLASRGDTRSLRTNTVLRAKDWEVVDKALLLSVKRRLQFVAELHRRGLVYNVGAGMAALVLMFEKMGSFGKAKISMDGEVHGEEDRPTFEPGYLPLPIVHQDFSINVRVLEAARLHGTALDTTAVEQAGTSLAEELEDLAVLGDSSFSYGGGSILGLTTAPNRNLGTFTDWLDSGADPVADALAMKQASITAGFRGPWTMWSSPEYETILDEDYSAVKGSNTVRQRIAGPNGIQGIESCGTLDNLPAGTLMLVQMTGDVVRMVQALKVQNVEWKEGAGMRTKFKSLCIEVPQVRDTKEGKSGITHFSKS